MAPLGMLVIWALTASPVCVQPAEVMLARDVKRVQIVSRPRYPKDECDGITGRECPFGDVNAIAARRMSAATAIRALGWAERSDKGICLPPGVSVDDVLLRFDEGDVDPLNEVVLLRSRRITVHANGRVLLTPSNLVGRTDGGVWSHDVVTDPYRPQSTLLTIIPDDPSLSAQVLSVDGTTAALADVTSDKNVEVSARPRMPVFTPEVTVTGDRKGPPVSVLVHGWCDSDRESWDPDPGPGPITLPLKSAPRRLLSDRPYVVEARQGSLRAAAPIDAAATRAVLALAPQARIDLVLVDEKSTARSIWQVKVVERSSAGANPFASDAGTIDLERSEECERWHGWDSPPLEAPVSVATFAVPPGPNRSICVLGNPNPKGQVWVAIPAPAAAGAYSVRLRCSTCDLTR
jgi:hypothetical protein